MAWKIEVFKSDKMEPMIVKKKETDTDVLSLLTFLILIWLPSVGCPYESEELN